MARAAALAPGSRATEDYVEASGEDVRFIRDQGSLPLASAQRVGFSRSVSDALALSIHR
jgi:hypothetical protein